MTHAPPFLRPRRQRRPGAPAPEACDETALARPESIPLLLGWRQLYHADRVARENGLRYYIRANQRPEKRAELRLVINAGSTLEDDDQQGVAHLVEHMAFNGTEHFPKQEVISFIESIGMRFGADLNAQTTFDETIYKLQIPTDKPDVVDRALLVLARSVEGEAAPPHRIQRNRRTPVSRRSLDGVRVE